MAVVGKASLNLGDSTEMSARREDAVVIPVRDHSGPQSAEVSAT